MTPDGSTFIEAKPRSKLGKQGRAPREISAESISASMIAGDCLEKIKKLKSDHFDLVVTSPPYFIGKEYDTSQSIDEFANLHKDLFPELIRILKKGGSVCWQVGYHVSNGRVLPLDYVVQQVASKFPELVLRNRIIWTFRHGVHCQTRFSGRHEVILWYTKGESYSFNLDSVRVPQLYPGKRSYKGEKKGRPSGNPLGKNPSDVWDIPNVKALHPEKTEHPCQFPTALVRRLVKALSPQGGHVLDPFAGSGSAGVAAVIEKRSFVGIERNFGYVEVARKRLRAALKGKAKIRDDVPVRLPRQNEAVAKRPKHFRYSNES